MEEVINKTKELILSFEESSLIKNLEHYKSLVVRNRNLVAKIQKFNASMDDHEKIVLKRQIYQNNDYQNFMKYYTELFYLILRINNRFKQYTNVKGCH